jgi:hypothetical protein
VASARTIEDSIQEGRTCVVKIALIPPTPELPAFPSTGIHLLLSHLFEDERYVSFYQDCHKKGDYVILDNSAHEQGSGESLLPLLQKATLVGADEVVIPDVLFDATGTYKSAEMAFKWLRRFGKEAYKEAGEPAVMLVPQGYDKREWIWCLRKLIQVYNLHCDIVTKPPVIGVSKDYYEFRGGLVSLICDYVAEEREKQSVECHCLGWPSSLWEIAKVAQRAPWVRSTDSAKPFVYAISDILLEPGGRVPKYPHRQEDYFNLEMTEVQRQIASRNVAVYEAAANNELVDEA